MICTQQKLGSDQSIRCLDIETMSHKLPTECMTKTDLIGLIDINLASFVCDKG